MKRGLFKHAFLVAITKVVEVESNVTDRGWPPPCLGLLYQPKRPVARRISDNEVEILSKNK